MKSIYRTGYFLQPAPENVATAFMIGGKYYGAGAVSPNSRTRLLQLASLGVTEGPLRLPGWPSPSINLLYGWTCAICEGTFSYRQRDNDIDIVECVRGESYSDFPHPYYPEAFREVYVEPLALTQEQQAIIVQLNSSNGDAEFQLANSNPDLSTPRHQVGGEPYYVSGRSWCPVCPLCKKQMPFLASIGNSTFCDSLGFAGNEFVQVVYHLCHACNVLSARNVAD